MINEVDESVRNLIRAEVVNGADVDVLFDAPTREWAARRNTPTVDMYLYDIREDIRRRQIGMIDRRDEQGMVVERRDVPRFFKLAYSERTVKNVIHDITARHQLRNRSHAVAYAVRQGLI